jgi:DNA-binding transcriptional LysR family regulator
MAIEFRLLEHAVAVGAHRNFARAAEALGLSQPSLSRSVASLERQLGVRLFDRTPRGVVPTTFGCLLLERGASVLQREADLRREIRALAGLDAGTLAVAAGPYPAETFIAAAIGRLSKEHPRLRISLMEAEGAQVLRDVLAERADVGVAGFEILEKDPRLVVQRLAARRFHFACRPGHPLVREARLTLARILDYPLVTTVLHGTPAAYLAGHGTLPKGRRPTEAVPQIAVNAAALGLGIVRASDAVFPATMPILAADLAAGRLVTLDFDAPVLRLSAGIFHLRDRTLSPAARAFLDILREVEAQSAEGEPEAAPRRERAVKPLRSKPPR